MRATKASSLTRVLSTVPLLALLSHHKKTLSHLSPRCLKYQSSNKRTSQITNKSARLQFPGHATRPTHSSHPSYPFTFQKTRHVSYIWDLSSLILALLMRPESYSAITSSPYAASESGSSRARIQINARQADRRSSF